MLNVLDEIPGWLSYGLPLRRNSDGLRAARQLVAGGTGSSVFLVLIAGDELGTIAWNFAADVDGCRINFVRVAVAARQLTLRTAPWNY